MKNVLLIVICLLFIIPSNSVFAHKRAKYNIVIDTDGGIDDFRALTYFLASRDFNINSITTVDGVLHPYQSTTFIKKLLNIYNHQGIPLGMGKNNSASKKYSQHALPYWEKMFGNEYDEFEENAVEVMHFAIKNERNRTIIVALGPLTNIADLVLRYPEIIPNIEMILWYSRFDKKPHGYNYEQDKKAFEDIIKNKIPIKTVSGESVAYRKDFVEICSEINSIYAKTISEFFKDVDDKALFYWDDLLPVYLIFPSLFNEAVAMDYLRTIKPKQENYFDIIVTSILNTDKPDEGVVFNEVPTSGFMLRKDVEAFAPEILQRHGYIEFKIAALTSEIHSHMGIYSILGAKTGLRIMEYLHAGLDEIEIVSYAGLRPPISCFNDGIQVGTGSTLGYGTISIDSSPDIKPAVLVKYNGRKILFSLKEEVINEIKKDVGGLIKEHGLESDMYWIKLRELSIEKYWLGMSRFEILEIEEK